ncbi:MAG TPA: DUF5615 family PIN-like protein [Planctomycetota bacterium]|nr:DUF5615 family PIN-like protein [Planctomycetota bacterium]
MRILVDVCLSPQWVEYLQGEGAEVVHWTSVGDPRAKDREIMHWAREHGYVVFTNDLDFGTILAVSSAPGPSVLLIRAQDVLPSAIGAIILEILSVHRDPLERGAVVSVDQASARVRILPIRRRDAE